MDIGIDLQLQIFILAGVFGLIFIIIIFFLAGICGQISKIKRQQRNLHSDSIGQITGYDNYAYNSRNIQPDEELGRRGFTMYDPYNRNNNQTTPNVHQNAQNNNAKSSSKTVEITRQNHAAEVAITRDGSRDATSDYSIANTETVVMTGNDVEMKIRATYPPEFRGIPPPPAFVNRLDITNEPNTSTAKTEEHQ